MSDKRPPPRRLFPGSFLGLVSLAAGLLSVPPLERGREREPFAPSPERARDRERSDREHGYTFERRVSSSAHVDAAAAKRERRRLRDERHEQARLAGIARAKGSSS